ncbi:hypothetical protein BKA67DRAFT_672363 [Truncatella angustata]|uniref:Uncharacterized protein n=1 Tax=Truncatella angustata TaxID=152316 RepID=A0A9P8UQR7_9PEZI|nr:uncharacterized protein BKA67DRAFT_672363 [Truncatella angustata]KAH6656638.1 hypothetical protein BKA67DRAFT_672363 [Truncatella angustata]
MTGLWGRHVYYNYFMMRNELIRVTKLSGHVDYLLAPVHTAQCQFIQTESFEMAIVYARVDATVVHSWLSAFGIVGFDPEGKRLEWQLWSISFVPQYMASVTMLTDGSGSRPWNLWPKSWYEEYSTYSSDTSVNRKTWPLLCRVLMAICWIPDDLASTNDWHPTNIPALKIAYIIFIGYIWIRSWTPYTSRVKAPTLRVDGPMTCLVKATIATIAFSSAVPLGSLTPCRCRSSEPLPTSEAFDAQGFSSIQSSPNQPGLPLLYPAPAQPNDMVSVELTHASSELVSLLFSVILL